MGRIGRARFERIQRELADEHRRIMGLVQRLEDEAGLAELPVLLEELHALLINHFAREQFPGGLYEALGQGGSRHHAPLRTLVREHCELLSSTRGLVERARNVGLQDAAGLREELATVLKRLREHEEKEHALVQERLAR